MKMVLFSRAFIRKRMISLAATASVSATSFAVAGDPSRVHHVHGGMPFQYVADRADHSGEQSFLSENAAAMKDMMADMRIKPTGDVDRDFVAMTVPRHQGAIETAKAELKCGHNERLRGLAQQSIAKQQQGIVVMRDAVADRASAPARPSEQPDAEFVSANGPGRWLDCR
jgi:predicted outer membrane protein